MCLALVPCSCALLLCLALVPCSCALLLCLALVPCSCALLLWCELAFARFSSSRIINWCIRNFLMIQIRINNDWAKFIPISAVWGGVCVGSVSRGTVLVGQRCV